MAANPVIRPAELRLDPEKRGSETIVRAAGRITSVTSVTLESTLRDLISENKRVVLDLTQVDYIDSSGLGALVSLYTHATRNHCDLEIANPRPRISDLFSRSGLAAVFKAVEEAGERHEELFGMTPS
jgi:anti-sigma B factor antagonist